MTTARKMEPLRIRTMSGLGLGRVTAGLSVVIATRWPGLSRARAGLQTGGFERCNPRLRRFGGRPEHETAQANAADSSVVIRDRGLEVIDIEVRPQRLRDEHLRVGGLPEQEVAHAALACGPDDEVRVR